MLSGTSYNFQDVALEAKHFPSRSASGAWQRRALTEDCPHVPRELPWLEGPAVLQQPALAKENYSNIIFFKLLEIILSLFKIKIPALVISKKPKPGCSAASQGT